MVSTPTQITFFCGPVLSFRDAISQRYFA